MIINHDDDRTINKARLSNTTVINISRHMSDKMAAKNGWHRYERKLRYCHPVYKERNCAENYNK